MFLSAARKRPVKKANLSLRYRRVSEKGNLLCPFFEDFFHAGIHAIHCKTVRLCQVRWSSQTEGLERG